jgi:uroporphyrinogen III methyltransferase/synthase
MEHGARGKAWGLTEKRGARDQLPNLSRPLAGRRIVITRARAQASSLAQRLTELGGEVVECPTIEIQAPKSYAAVDDAIANIAGYNWVIFTSVNGVKQFVARCEQGNVPVTVLQKLQVAAIGPETAKSLRAAGVRGIMVPNKYQAEGLLEVLGKKRIRGKRVLIPRAAKARDILPDTLRQWGAEVNVVEAYRTVLPRTDIAALKKRLADRKVDVITFTSSSTVANFMELFAGQKLAELLPESAIACIGPITKKTVEDLGRKVDIVSREYTIAGLVRAIVNYFRRKTEKL